MTDPQDAQAVDAATDRASWRQLDPHLWVGHDGTVNLGTIEHGARYVFVDPDGAAHPGVGSLRDAQVMATGPIRLPVQPEGAPAMTPRLKVVVIVAVVLAGFALVLAIAWAVTSALLIG